MIYTITPNPALDLGGVVDEIVPDEKNYVYEETRFPGGNGINVARMLTSLEVPVIASGFLGGASGQEIRMLLDQEKVVHQFIEISGRTRTSVTVSNKKTLRQTRLSFPGPTLQDSEIEKLMDQVRQLQSPSLVELGGSYPPQFLGVHLKKIIEIAKANGIATGVDVPGKNLKEAVDAGVLFIKPNLVEFQDLVQKPVLRRDEVLVEAKNLLKNVPLICISSVEGGALLLTRSCAWFGRGPEVKIKSTVGAGDSMVAAMSAQLWKNQVLSERNASDTSFCLHKAGDLLRWGLAAASATLTTTGTQLGRAREIREYYSFVNINRIEYP